jgi:hypothetical protein
MIERPLFRQGFFYAQKKILKKNTKKFVILNFYINFGL